MVTHFACGLTHHTPRGTFTTATVFTTTFTAAVDTLEVSALDAANCFIAMPTRT